MIGVQELRELVRSLREASSSALAADLQEALMVAVERLELSAGNVARVEDGRIIELWSWPAASSETFPQTLRLEPERRIIASGEPAVLLPRTSHHRALFPLVHEHKLFGLAEFSHLDPISVVALTQLDTLAEAMGAALARRQQNSGDALAAQRIQARDALRVRQSGGQIVGDFRAIVRDVDNASQGLRGLMSDLPKDVGWALSVWVERLEKAVARGHELAHHGRLQAESTGRMAVGTVLDIVGTTARRALPEGVAIQVVHMGCRNCRGVSNDVPNVLSGLLLSLLAVPNQSGLVVLEARVHAEGPQFSVRAVLGGGDVSPELRQGVADLGGTLRSMPDGITLLVPYATRPLELPIPEHTVVLAVDDEPLILEVIERILTREGYQVLTADSGANALEVARSHLGAIDLLLTDLVLPDVSGFLLRGQICQIATVGATLYMSGYHDDALRARGVRVPSADRLRKPFLPSELTRRIAAILADVST